jgi:hypothetical protein
MKLKVLRVPEPIHGEAKKAAKSHGMSLDSFTHLALREKIDRDGVGFRADVKRLTRKAKGAL